MNMRIIHFLIVFISLFSPSLISAQRSDKISRVLQYRPAPGQHINRLFPTPAMSNTPENALAFANARLVNNAGMLGLGAFGGFVVVAFDHPIINVRGEYNFKVLGNAFTNSSEPGIVMVAQDLNKNGTHDPHEPWYELAGSEYRNPSTVHHYEITYFRPDPDGQKAHVRFVDNLGNEGFLQHISFATQATMYPLWESANSLTFKGTKLANNASQSGTFWQLPALPWGYVDNHANTESNDRTSFKIDWAVDDSGNPVHLEYIDFIRVHTGMIQQAGWLGETSTELTGMISLHTHAEPARFPPTGSRMITLDLQNTTTLANNPLPPNSRWADTYTENVVFESQNFIFSHRAGWGGTYWDGFTISNVADNSNHFPNWVPNQWGSMTKGGVDGVGSPFLIGYWGFFNDFSVTHVTQTSNFVQFKDGKPHRAIGMFVTNAPWSYYGIKQGDQFARPFVQGDYFKLIATGYAADGVTVTGTTEKLLADYRSVNPLQWRIVDSWEWMDLTALGEVSYIQFTMESTDTGLWGINTATMFCIDKLTVEKLEDITTHQPAPLQLQAYRSGRTLYQLPVGGTIRVFAINGLLRLQQKITQPTLELPDNALYIIHVESTQGNQVLR